MDGKIINNNHISNLLGLIILGFKKRKMPFWTKGPLLSCIASYLLYSLSNIALHPSLLNKLEVLSAVIIISAKEHEQ